MKVVQVKLHIDNQVQPVAQKHRRVSFHLREKLDTELERLEKAGIIEKVETATDWVSPIVITPKKSTNDIRVCVDMGAPNRAIKRVRHVNPTIEDLRYDVNGAKVFSKLDLAKGFHQLELHEDSWGITTFSTRVGLRRFRSLTLVPTQHQRFFMRNCANYLQESREFVIFMMTFGSQKLMIKITLELCLRCSSDFGRLA